MVLRGFPQRSLAFPWIVVMAGWLAPSGALATPIHEVLPYTWTQTGLTITDLSGPFENWDTGLRYTNSTAQTITNVRLWFYGARLNGEFAQWDNTTLQGTTSSGLTWLGNNHTSHLALGMSNIPILPGYGLDASSTVPTWLLGDIAPGGFVDFHAETLASDATNQKLFFGFAFTQQAPEPGLLLLLGIGFASLARVRRRAQ